MYCGRELIVGNLLFKKTYELLTYQKLKIMEKNEKSQERKKGRVNGSITQKVYSFRLDGDLIEWLYRQPNKGRYINDLIRDDMDKFHI